MNIAVYHRWPLVVMLVALVLIEAACGAAPAPVAPTATPNLASTPAATATSPPAATSAATATIPPAQPPVAPTAASPASVVPATPGPAGTVSWRGGAWFLLGLNYPYYHYGNDFGGNAWGAYGVHDPATYATVDADFARMAALGVHMVRWFVFADGRAGIVYDETGLPTGLDQWVFPDFDAALALATRHNLGLDLVLLDYRFLWNARTDNGVQLGGHASIIATPAGQDALINKVFEPLFQRYAGHPAILSWEVMNEPEWAISDAGRVANEVGQPVALATFRAFAGRTVEAIHRSARAYATIGCADMKWLQNWAGLGLDYYQVHYYDWMQPYSTDNLFGTRAAALHLDRPLVVGEFPAAHSKVADLHTYLDIWYAGGYAGAWAWSFRDGDTWGTPDPAMLRGWADAHAPAVAIPPAGASR